MNRKVGFKFSVIFFAVTVLGLITVLLPDGYQSGAATLATQNKRTEKRYHIASLYPSTKPARNASESFVRLTSTRHQKSVHPQRLKKAIQQSAGYLINACDFDGKFEYRINLNPKIEVKPGYNMLRHAGTIYALGMYSHASPDEITQMAMARAARFLRDKTIHALPGRSDLLAVWSDPQIILKQRPLEAKLGGTGLGLVALLSMEKIKPATTPIEYLRKMGNFLRYMQKEDGSFYCKYIPSAEGRSDRWKSLYYPGEAALGLLMLNERDPSPAWLNAAADAIANLARIRADKTEVEADHWALLATAKLLPIYDRSHQPLPRKAILDHAIQICTSILNQAEQVSPNPTIYGCFTDDGRTTPTATRLEGLLAALAFLPQEHDALRKRIKDHVKKGISFLLGSQITKGQYAGAIPRGVHPLPQTHPHYTRSFNRRVSEVRIDYVQHALSAMIQYDRMFFHTVDKKGSIIKVPSEPEFEITIAWLHGSDHQSDDSGFWE